MGYGIPIMPRLLVVDVQITSTTTGTQYKFPDNEILTRNKNVKVVAIETFTSGQSSKTPSGYTAISDAGALGVSLTLFNKQQVQVVDGYPLYGLITANNGGVVKEMEPFSINLTECYITVLDGSGITANQGVQLAIWYYPEA